MDNKTAVSAILWSYLFKLTNAFGSSVASLGLDLAPLNAEKLLANARKKTGLEDYGEELFGEQTEDGKSEFREGLSRLLIAAEKEAELTAIGRIALRQDVLRLLKNRLQLVADRKRYPEIGQQEIEAPVAIVSFPRTGTTLLHGLLAQDPQFRVPRSWEVMYPSPPPGISKKEDSRIRRVEKEFTWFDRLTSSYKLAHPIGAKLPQECIEIPTHTFQSERFYRTFHVPSYVEWLDSRSLTTAYRFHRAFLQHLQWQTPGKWWVLKNPPHIFSIAELCEVYPDLRFIQTHRDPVTVMASFMSHTRKLRAAFTNHTELFDVETTVNRWVNGMEKLMDFRTKNKGIPWLDIQYNKLLTEPMETIQNIYDYLDLTLSGKTADSMREFLRKHPQHEYGIHRYSPEEYGIDVKYFGSFLARYRERFGVEADKEM